ncbi:hypothetical protein EJ02DRAFT_25068 [Clathrospora elynae]|uniref:Uncharacterized protein n=1 Tax=Clathrospora elynae TaxID=706981 RepID=A0A6A5TA47_9PLEO|nr:hypothetical protein EJ02DRAFT_25068 [Clathrospora elynae]
MQVDPVNRRGEVLNITQMAGCALQVWLSAIDFSHPWLASTACIQVSWHGILLIACAYHCPCWLERMGSSLARSFGRPNRVIPGYNCPGWSSLTETLAQIALICSAAGTGIRIRRIAVRLDLK